MDYISMTSRTLQRLTKKNYNFRTQLLAGSFFSLRTYSSVYGAGRKMWKNYDRSKNARSLLRVPTEIMYVINEIRARLVEEAVEKISATKPVLPAPSDHSASVHDDFGGTDTSSTLRLFVRNRPKQISVACKLIQLTDNVWASNANSSRLSIDNDIMLYVH